MEGRVSRGRGGSWKRGGRGRSDGETSGGEPRGRGRGGGHHRGRNKRDHHRDRGRGAAFNQGAADGEDLFEEEDDMSEMFSRRKLESNWDRYEESEKQKAEDEAPTQRGADFQVLLESAGDSFTQFRFSEEKDWEMDPFTASQMSVVPLDLPALTQLLQQLPLHERLYLEEDLLLVSTPAELPAMPITSKAGASKTSSFGAPCAAAQNLNTSKTPTSGSSDPKASPAAAAAPLEEEDDEELEQLLSLQKGVPCVGAEQLSDGEPQGPQENPHEEEKMEEGRKNAVTPPKPVSVKQELTEEDLEDWLDSMIS